MFELLLRGVYSPRDTKLRGNVEPYISLKKGGLSNVMASVKTGQLITSVDVGQFNIFQSSGMLWICYKVYV